MDSAGDRDRGPQGAPVSLLWDPVAFRSASLEAQRAALAELAGDELEPWLERLAGDPRLGRQRLASSLRRREERRQRREARWAELSDFDREAAGGKLLAGVDEVGRGPLAGPVTAAALILPQGYHAPGLDDSKRLSPAQREEWSRHLKRDALAWGVGDVAAADIDRLGIREAVFTAMALALRGLETKPERILIDGSDLPRGARISRAVVGGDRRSLSIAGASVLAKVHRDEIMRGEDERWPGYGFARHKGYGSAAHCEALQRLGPCPLHRRSFCGRCLAKREGARGAGSSG